MRAWERTTNTHVARQKDTSKNGCTTTTQFQQKKLTRLPRGDVADKRRLAGCLGGGEVVDDKAARALGDVDRLAAVGGISSDVAPLGARRGLGKPDGVEGVGGVGRVQQRKVVGAGERAARLCVIFFVCWRERW